MFYRKLGACPIGGQGRVLYEVRDEVRGVSYMTSGMCPMGGEGRVLWHWFYNSVLKDFCVCWCSFKHNHNPRILTS